MARLDPHSWNDTTQPAITALTWRARVDFDARVLDAEAIYDVAGPGPIDLDTRDLDIARVTDQGGHPLPFELGAPDAILGSRLRIQLADGTRAVHVHYRTAPAASALQWLTPAQTFGGKHPFLFSQCQAIHARSVVPVQDTPRLRITYRAELDVPAHLRSLMAAGFVGREVRGDRAVDTWAMPQPIPPYLFAFAVGDLDSRELGPRSRVWAEPGVVDRAAWEFAGVDSMISAAEALFGPYDWDRFDILTMPPSFPYGGMENPRLTFLTPTLLAGDRSLVNVLGHELAHSWTGNLVSNASAEHFWLNEGFTVFAERRILEAVGGPEVTALHAAIGRRDLERAVERFKDHPELTRLRTHLEGVDPDEAFSSIPYEKGYLFLRTLEEAVGRPAFDIFLRKYITRFRFQAITTEDFLAFLHAELPDAAARVDIDAWVHGAGIPDGAPAPRSERLDAVSALGHAIPEPAHVESFTPTEWQLYLSSLPRPLDHARCEQLDARFGLTSSENHEVLCAWLELAAVSNYGPALGRVEEVLGRVGRMKYLRPLYVALARSEATRPVATSCFTRFRDGYHPIAQQVVEGVLKQHGAL